jgi:hypothetical protein
MTWDWNGRAAAGCRHGYPHGDCPMACGACGHRCELHGADGLCGAVECPCTGWLEDEEPDEDASHRYDT